MERLILPLGFGIIALLFWRLPERLRLPMLVTTFTSALLWLAPLPAAIMLAVSVVTFLASRTAVAGESTVGPLIATGLIALISAYLAYAKYWPAIAASVAGGSVESLLVPIGLSYWTFRLIHYAIDQRSGDLPAHGFTEFLSYVTFLPIFASGPIERFDRFLANRQPTLGRQDLVEASRRLVFGTIKAFALPLLLLAAMPFANIDEAVTTLVREPDQASPGLAWLTFFAATTTTYLNFSGYTDIALGSARLLGFRICENFNSPFLATSLANFWQRWHISLGEWCRTYVFFPMARLTRNAAAAALLSFIAIGLWHQGTLQWLCFGLWHGVGIVTEAALARRGVTPSRLGPAGPAVAWALTMTYVLLASAFSLLSGKYPIWESVRLLALAFGMRL